MTDRIGYIAIHDTSLNIWEDEVDARLDRVVLGPLVAFLRSRGWSVNLDATVDKIIRKHYRIAQKCQLHASVRLGGRHIAVEMWSDDYIGQNRNGNRYDFDKRKSMPYASRVRADVEINATARWASATFGYPVAGDTRPRMTTVERIAKEYSTNAYHNDPALGYPRPSPRDATAGDGGTVEQGATVWVRRRDGRVVRGTAYYRLNNMWGVVTGEYDAEYVSAHELFTSPPAVLRRQASERSRREKLERELRNALTTEDYDRAKLIRAIAFGDGPLYRIRCTSGKHQPPYDYWATNSSGYTVESKAGRYTAAEALRLVRSGGVVAEPIGKAPPLALETLKEEANGNH